MKINKVSPDSSNYLKVLANIDDKPQALYYLGKIPKQRQPTIAIVGTRKPTSYGIEVAHQFASGLASRGFIIVSGLALGTDALAHLASYRIFIRAATARSPGALSRRAGQSCPNILPMTPNRTSSAAGAFWNAIAWYLAWPTPY